MPNQWKSSGNRGDLPRVDVVFDADNIFDNVALAPVGDAVLWAAPGGGVGAASLADVLVDNTVTESAEGAVVGGPAVFGARVAEAHVVEELVLEVLQKQGLWKTLKRRFSIGYGSDIRMQNTSGQAIILHLDAEVLRTKICKICQQEAHKNCCSSYDKDNRSTRTVIKNIACIEEER